MKTCLALFASLLFLTLAGCEEPPPTTPPQATQQCGTIAGLACPEANQYCNYGEGRCQIADADGVCETRPQACTEQFDPVCGCDNQTHGNACQAAAAGVSVLHKGECKKTPGA